MPKRVPPSTEEIGQLVKDRMEAMYSDEPLRVCHEDKAVRWVRDQYRTTLKAASGWLADAIEAGTVIMLHSSQDGRHQSQVKRSTMDGPARFMYDTIDGLDQSMVAGVWLDINGRFYLQDERPEELNFAPNDTDWVTSPERLAEYVKTVNTYSAGKLAQLSAKLTVTKSLIDIQVGPAADLIAGLLWLAGQDPRDQGTITAHLYKDEANLHIGLSGAEAINAVAEVLKKAGIQPYEGWRR